MSLDRSHFTPSRVVRQVASRTILCIVLPVLLRIHQLRTTQGARIVRTDMHHFPPSKFLPAVRAQWPRRIINLYPCATAPSRLALAPPSALLALVLPCLTSNAPSHPTTWLCTIASSELDYSPSRHQNLATRHRVVRPSYSPSRHQTWLLAIASSDLATRHRVVKHTAHTAIVEPTTATAPLAQLSRNLQTFRTACPHSARPAHVSHSLQPALCSLASMPLAPHLRTHLMHT